MKILIIGRSEILYESAFLLNERYKICGIITAPSVLEYSKDEKDFFNLAENIQCPYLLTNYLNDDAIKFIRAVQPDVAASVNWVSIINKNVIQLIPKGILNAHFGDLPRYRGNAVINWALLKYEPSITLTIHFMEAGELDAGDILLQKRMLLKPRTTIKEILEFATENTPQMFLETLIDLERGKLKSIEQCNAGKRAFRCYPRIPLDSKIDWNKSAREIDALVRASTRPYNGAYSYLRVGEEIFKVYIWESYIVEEESKDIGSPGHIIKNDKVKGESWIYTGKGILAITLVQYEKDPEAFKPGRKWKSIRIRFGVDLEDEIIKLKKELSDINQKLSVIENSA